MNLRTDSLLPIVGLDLLREASAQLTDAPASEEELDAVEAMMEGLFESSLCLIQMQVDHVKGTLDDEVGFGRILAVARHCLIFSSEGEGTTVFPQIAEEGEGIFVEGLLISACTGYTMTGFTDGLPQPRHGNWEEGSYLHLVSGPDMAERGFEEGEGFYVPVLHADLYNPSAAKAN